MKKYILNLLLAALLSVCMGTTAFAEESGEAIQIVATIFPEYDWVQQILGDQAENAELTLLLDSGVDLHNYQPTVDDILAVSDCDLFLYVGGESDEWVDDVLKEAVNEGMVVLDLLELLGDSAVEEETVEGMEAGEEENDEEEEGETEYDEHVWLSLKNAQVFCEAIAEALEGLDPDNADLYAENAAEYVSRLSALDEEYQAAVDGAAVTTLLFGDRFPFRYLTEDYGLDYYAAFSGCSAESEASFETITFLAGKVDELGLNYVMKIESSDGKIAQTIISCTSTQEQEVLTLNSMQSVTLQDVEEGVTYLSIMEENLEVLTQALQ
ncbi:MAG: metal ABC transporter substrate-binding protein [Lachnospiraceae bacterium]|nr:metal ABC transporter substrate-binding protein [Lachnospiraceae bacterium]